MLDRSTISLQADTVILLHLRVRGRVNMLVMDSYSNDPAEFKQNRDEKRHRRRHPLLVVYVVVVCLPWRPSFVVVAAHKTKVEIKAGMVVVPALAEIREMLLTHLV
jgi:hypothetical protein